jgi:hypothetical protein
MTSSQKFVKKISQNRPRQKKKNPFLGRYESKMNKIRQHRRGVTTREAF